MTLLMSPTHLTTCCRHVGMLAADMSDWGSSRHNTMLTILTKRDRQHHGEPNSTFQCMRLKRIWACSLSIWGIGAIVNVLHLHHKLFRNLHPPCQHNQWSRIKEEGEGNSAFQFIRLKDGSYVHWVFGILAQLSFFYISRISPSQICINHASITNSQRDRQHHEGPISAFQCIWLQRMWACSLSNWGKLFRNLHQPCQHHQ